MLLTLLLHLLVFHLLTARDAPLRKETGYLIKHVDTCPDVGYFFKRSTSANAIESDTCHLCFCQGENTAVCWKRDNRRCNKESFHYHGVGKRDTRYRRSPGLADIFFRDASRDFFDKNTKAECKPFESSFSDDCPPADWCTGCTVCDCDANGHWDCHLLSFCPDDKNSKSDQKSGRTKVIKKHVKAKKTTTTTAIPARRKNLHSALKKASYKGRPKPKPRPPVKRQGNNKGSPQKQIVKKSIPGKVKGADHNSKKRPPVRYKRIASSKKSQTKKPATQKKIIKKNTVTHKPIEIKSNKLSNLEMQIADNLMKKVMENLRRTVKAEVYNMSKIAVQHAAKQMNMINNGNSPPVMSNQKPNPKQNQKNTNKRQVKKKPVYRTKKPQEYRRPAVYPYGRRKRDAMNSYNNVNPGVFTDSTHTTETVYIKPITSNSLLEDYNWPHTLAANNTLPTNEYYKYVVASETSKPKVNRSVVIGTSQDNMTETVFKLIGTHIATPLSTYKNYKSNVKTNKINLTEMNPKENVIKFSKKSHLKILNEKITSSPLENQHSSLVKLITHANKTIILDDNKNRVYGKNVTRKFNSRKYNIVKLLNSHPKCKGRDCNLNNNINDQMEKKNTSNFQSLLTNILGDYLNERTTISPKRRRKFSVLKYLKRILHKLFRRKKMSKKYSKQELIETLCENFGPCKVNRNDKPLLNAKVNELDKEIIKILKTVRIIKGLLKLIDLPKGGKDSKQENFSNEMHKLNQILRGTYFKNEQFPTITQLTQMEYIKKNTQDFIQSVSKFASLLNEIISILTKESTVKTKNINLEKNLLNKNLTKDDPFVSLKNLLVKYNLVQNTFMKQMYEQLNNFEYKYNEKPKVSDIKKLNNSVAIENFSRHIIQNLRKLKHLVQAGSYNGRMKRSIVRDDDAMEYLLMLMEYLIKQNNPLDAVPVNDGIDLLIEAIKNAPDIKPIRKKVLDYSPFTETITTPFSTSMTTENIFEVDDHSSESEKTSSEFRRKFKPEDTTETRLDENKEIIDMVGDDEGNNEDKSQPDRRAEREKADVATEMVFYNKFEVNTVPEPETIFETTSLKSTPVRIEKSDTFVNKVESNIEKGLLENKNLEKSNSYGDLSEKKVEVYTSEMEEDIVLPVTLVTETETETTTAAAIELSTQTKRRKGTTRKQFNLEAYGSDSIDKKSKLEWIEENFGNTQKREKEAFEETKSTVAIRDIQSKTIAEQPKDIVDVSSLTKETGIEIGTTKKKSRVNPNAEDVMLRKQMDLLNSLDYGTEKGEVLELDSKDGGNTEDRYSSDGFPSYFV